MMMHQQKLTLHSDYRKQLQSHVETNLFICIKIPTSTSTNINVYAIIYYKGGMKRREISNKLKRNTRRFRI